MSPPSQPSDQARLYELQGSLHRLRDRSSTDAGGGAGGDRGAGSFRRAEAELARSTRGADPVPHAGNSPPQPAGDGGGSPGTGESYGGSGEAAPGPTSPGRRKRLPVWTRVALIGVAVLLAGVGIAGLFLPGLQGILTLLLALAVLSLVSRTMHRLLRWALGPWPGLRKRVERHRRRSHHWLHDRIERFSRWRRRRRHRRSGTADGDPGEGRT